jgi:hypothetical protein
MPKFAFVDTFLTDSGQKIELLPTTLTGQIVNLCILHSVEYQAQMEGSDVLQVSDRKFGRNNSDVAVLGGPGS